MSTGRSIHLDVQVPHFGARNLLPDTRGGQPQTLPQPDEDATQQFKAAVEGQASQAQAPLEVASSEDGQMPASLFELLGTQRGVSQVPVGPVSTAPQPPSEWAYQMGESIEQLMVDDGHNGSRQVRMQLKEEVLPGVTVAIQESEGRLRVDFICSVEASRLRLNVEAAAHAQTLAERLQRDVLVCVQTDDEDDLCLLETLASI